MTCHSHTKSHRLILFVCALLIALISPLPYPGSWNDGSRLASVEALVDYHTWSIDDSVFVNTPGKTSHTAQVYPADQPILTEHGTRDKMFIHRHYYSDKSPVPTLAMAAVYKLVQIATGLKAAENSGLFCWLITFVFSGVAYVISVCCIDALAGKIGLSCVQRLLFSYGFALATVALTYTRQVNNHIMLLAVFSMIMLLAVGYAETSGEKPFSWRLFAIGSLAGVGYTIDLGVGPVLVLCVIGFVIAQARSFWALCAMLASAFPWFLLHHIFNYKIGGTFMPANTVPAWFEWPGSPFNASNLTGGWAHPNIWHFVVYALDLLFGKRGFFGHNMAIYLVIPAAVVLLRKKVSPLIWFSIALILGTWLIYAITSNNYSGPCCSIRWFVPLLAPFYYILAVFLKERPEFTGDFFILTAWGLLAGLFMWFKGPWMQHMIPGYWPLQAVALITWLGWRWRRRSRHVPS